MKKVNCSNCGTLNYEKVTICSNCRKPVSKTNSFISQNTKRKAQSPKKTTSFDFQKIGKIVLNTLLLIGLGVGGYFGYQKYTQWAEEQKLIEITRKEEQEMANFTEVSFEADKSKYDRVDKSSFDAKVMTLPKPFRMEPPELIILNTFRFSEKTARKVDPRKIGSSLGQINSGIKGETAVGIVDIVSEPEAYQMSKVTKILGYKYSKNAKKELVCEVQVEAEILHSVFSDEKWKQKDNAPIAGKGKITLVRNNDKWDLNAINITGNVITIPGYNCQINWYSETAHLGNNSQ